MTSQSNKRLLLIQYLLLTFSKLLHPLGEKSPIEGFLKKKTDGGIHHICIEVNITVINMLFL